MTTILNDMFSHSFITRALIVGVLVSLCSALLGVSLVLKRFSMIGDGLSHVGFGALALSSALGLAPLGVAVPVVIISAFFLLRIRSSAKIKGDTAIAIISTSAIAFGVLVVSVAGTNTDLQNYLFGSILSLSNGDTVLSVILSLIVVSMFLFTYPRVFAITFDEDFSKATGTNVGLFNTILAVLTAITIVLGMRMMGTMLISCIIIFPPVTAMRLCKTFKSVCICASLISAFSFFLGLVLSYLLNLPTGATVVMVNLILLLIFSFIKFIKIKIRNI